MYQKEINLFVNDEEKGESQFYMNICVIGCGYVGMSIAVAIAKNKMVSVWDNDPIRLNKISACGVSFDDEMLRREFVEHKHNIIIGENEVQIIEKNDVFILALSTDYIDDLESLDTSGLESWIMDIVKSKIENSFKIVIKSTIPIGFTNQMRDKYNCKNIFFIPEFLREGNAYNDVINPTRIIVGGTEADLSEIVESIYSKSNMMKTQYISVQEAESIKLFSNAYLAMRVAFFNELDIFAEKHDLNVSNVIQGVCEDPRIGNYYNNPSFGYGGYCLPKDTRQLATILNEDGVLINAIVVSNEKRKKNIAKNIANKGKKIGVYRLQMKKNSDNVRGAAIFDVLEELLDLGMDVAVYEPLLDQSKIKGKITICKNLKELDEFSEIIVANRMDDDLAIYKDKVYTRDIFFRD